MNTKSLKELVSEEVWQQCSAKLKKEGTVEVLHNLFDYIVDTLKERVMISGQTMVKRFLSSRRGEKF